MMLRALSVILILSSVIGVPAVGASEWSSSRGPFQNGTSPDTNLPDKWSDDLKDPDNNLIWKAPFGCRSTPLVLNGRVYIINYLGDKETIQERVMCLDEKTGKPLWEHRFNVFHTDIVTVRLGWTNLAADPKTGNIFAHGTQGFLMCLDGKTGKVIWQRSLTEEYGRISGYGGRVTSPTIDGDLCIIGLVNSSWGDQGKGGNRWVAFDKNDGTVIWWADPAGQVKDTYYSAPVITNINGQRLLISGGADGGIHAVKVNTGEKVWSYNFGTGAINCAPVVDGSLIYCGHGEENPDSNVQGRVICLDASKVTGGQPALVWQKDGVKARYASPVLDTKNKRLYISDDIAKLYCFDSVTGKQMWAKSYGRNSRGSPVLADGKLYVGEVFSKFYILKPGEKKFEMLHEFEFPSPDGKSAVEINGSPAVANGKVFFSTSEEIICIGKKDGVSAPEPALESTKLPASGKPAHLQIYPADVVAGLGEKVVLKAKLFDENGNFLRETKAQWATPLPPLPPGAKNQPPALEAKVDDGILVIETKKPSQQGYVSATAEGVTGKARVRMAPNMPYRPIFANIPVGAVPGGWVNTQGKYVIGEFEGKKLLKKVNDKASPLIARGNAYFGPPSMKDYFVESDVYGTKVGVDMPDIGVGANRYTLYLAGNIQKLRLVSWDALPRIDKTIPFAWEPNKWYRLKLTVEVTKDANGAPIGVAKGKAWVAGTPEPKEWTVEVEDPRPNTEGSPFLYGYVTGIQGDSPGTEVLYDNVLLTPRKQ